MEENALTVQNAPAQLPVPRHKDYALTVRRFNEFAAGRPINEETVREFFAMEKQRGYSARTIALHKVAVKAGLLAAYPSHDSRIRSFFDTLFREIKLPKTELRVHSSYIFSRAEVRRFLAKAPKHVGLFARLLYDTGARVSEGLSIRLKDCKEDRGAVLAAVVGKGSKAGVLTISKKLFAQIRKTYGGKVYLFEHKGKPYTRQHMGHVMSKVSRQVLGRNMHPHTMRHSRITHLLEQGEPLDAVSRFARQSQTSTTLAFYAHTQLTSADILKSSL